MISWVKVVLSSLLVIIFAKEQKWNFGVCRSSLFPLSQMLFNPTQGKPLDSFRTLKLRVIRYLIGGQDGQPSRNPRRSLSPSSIYIYPKGALSLMSLLTSGKIGGASLPKEEKRFAVSSQEILFSPQRKEISTSLCRSKNWETGSHEHSQKLNPSTSLVCVT